MGYTIGRPPRGHFSSLPSTYLLWPTVDFAAWEDFSCQHWRDTTQADRFLGTVEHFQGGLHEFIDGAGPGAQILHYTESSLRSKVRGGGGRWTHGFITKQ